MKTRKLGWTDLNLTTIGLGTWAIGGGDWTFGWGPQDDAESLAAILLAIESGINWIDTAPAYGLATERISIIGRTVRVLPKSKVQMLSWSLQKVRSPDSATAWPTTL